MEFTLILLAILIWLLYRLYKKKSVRYLDKPKIFYRVYKKKPTKYRDEPKEDYIDTKKEPKITPRIKQKVEKRKPKRTKIEELLDNREKEQEELAKAREKNTPKFEEFSGGMKCNFKGKTFLFDKEGYEFYRREFILFGGLDIINNYLAINNPANEWTSFFHRYFMRIEIEDFCEENNCEGKDVVVHHIDFSRTNNRKENLRVMFKVEHDKLHNRT